MQPGFGPWVHSIGTRGSSGPALSPGPGQVLHLFTLLLISQGKVKHVSFWQTSQTGAYVLFWVVDLYRNYAADLSKINWIAWFREKETTNRMVKETELGIYLFIYLFLVILKCFREVIECHVTTGEFLIEYVVGMAEEPQIIYIIIGFAWWRVCSSGRNEMSLNTGNFRTKTVGSQ